MKRTNIIVLIITVLAFFVVSFPAYGAENVIRLKYANFFAPAHEQTVITEQWCKEVEKRTNGRVKITVFSGATLVSATQVYDATEKGVADIGQTIFAYAAGRFPLTEVIDLPLSYANGEQATKLINAYYKKFKPKELDDTKVMYLHAPGPGLFHVKKEIASLDQLKGMRIKATGNNAKIVQALGAVPVTVSVGETYEALQRGLCEGILMATDVLKSYKFGDFLKCTVVNKGMAYTSGMFVVMNKKKWNSLPPDIQKIIEQINEEWPEKVGKVWDEVDRKAEEMVLKVGHKFVQASKEDEEKVREKMQPILEEYVKNTKAKNLPGDEVLKFCLDYIKNYK